MILSKWYKRPVPTISLTLNPFLPDGWKVVSSWDLVMTLYINDQLIMTDAILSRPRSYLENTEDHNKVVKVLRESRKAFNKHQKEKEEEKDREIRSKAKKGFKTWSEQTK